MSAFAGARRPVAENTRSVLDPSGPGGPCRARDWTGARCETSRAPQPEPAGVLTSLIRLAPHTRMTASGTHVLCAAAARARAEAWTSPWHKPLGARMQAHAPPCRTHPNQVSAHSACSCCARVAGPPPTVPHSPQPGERTFCVQLMRRHAPQPSLPARPVRAMGLVRGIATAFQNGQVLRLPTEPKPHAPLISPNVAVFASRPCCGADTTSSGSAPPVAEPPVPRQRCKVVHQGLHTGQNTQARPGRRCRLGAAHALAHTCLAVQLLRAP